MRHKEGNIHYVYIHRRISDNHIFYIGKGNSGKGNNRHKHGYGRNKDWHKIADEHGWYSKIIKSNLSEIKALELETMLINRVGVYRLANKNYLNHGQSGYKHSEESKAMMSKSKMGIIPWNKGLKLPNLSISRMGKGNPRYGMKTVHSEETKRKLRQAFGVVVCNAQSGVFNESIEEACASYGFSRKTIFKRIPLFLCQG